MPTLVESTADTLGRFLAERCELGGDGIEFYNFYSELKRWLVGEGLPEIRPQRVFLAMPPIMRPTNCRSGVRFIRGVRLRGAA